MGSFKTYNINWYNALTGDPIVGTIGTTGLFEKLELNFPSVLTGDATLPIMFYEIYPSGGSFKLADPNISEKNDFEKVVNETQLVNNKSDIEVWPNPSQSKFVFEVGEEEIGGKWNIATLNGEIVKSGIVRSSKFVIDLEKFGAGVYFFKFSSRNKCETIKLLKQ